MAIATVSASNVDRNDLENQLNDLLIKLNDDNFDMCHLCMETITELQKTLQDPVMQDMVMELLRDLCDSLPEPTNKVCNAYVEAYVPDLIERLLDADPHDTCVMWHACPADFRVKMKVN
jgi:hypothetical protein